MVKQALAGRCIFCDPADEKILFTGFFWRAWQNRFAEEHTRHHFMIVPIRHVVTIDELTTLEWRALQELFRRLKKEFGYTAAGVLVRDNAPELAGTIEHLHFHVMVPDGTGRVETPFCKGSEKDGESLRRAIVFESLRRGVPFEDLPAVEQALVADRLGVK